MIHTKDLFKMILFKGKDFVSNLTVDENIIFVQSTWITSNKLFSETDYIEK